MTCELIAVAALESVDCYGYNVEVDIQRCCSNAQKFILETRVLGDISDVCT